MPISSPHGPASAPLDRPAHAQATRSGRIALTFPEAGWELSLGSYVIAKGFRAVPGFFADTGDGRVPEAAPAPRTAVAAP